MRTGLVAVGLASPEEILLTLTITLTVAGWRIVHDNKNYNPFRDAVWDAISKVEAINGFKEVPQ